MHPHRIKPLTKSLHPPLRTIQATDSEIIILLATLQHYQVCPCRENKPELAQAIPLIQGFMQRLYEQLPVQEEWRIDNARNK